MYPSLAQSKNSFVPAPLQAYLPYGFLVLCVFAAYGNIFDNVFLYDDKALIAANEYIQNWSHIGDILSGSTGDGAHLQGGFYRPLQLLLYVIAFHLGGTVFWFHLLNFSLHAANTCLVYKLGTKLDFNPGGVLLAALIWGLHPLQTEAITYMSGTADPLFTILCLWALILLVPEITIGKILKIVPLFLLGLLSKETMAMFPILVMACIFLTSKAPKNIRSYLCTWPLWLITIAYIIWQCPPGVFSGPSRIVYFFTLPDFELNKIYSESVVVRLYTYLATLPYYFGLLLFPTDLHMERAFGIYTNLISPIVLLGFGTFLLTAALITYSCHTDRYRPLSWGLLWFAAAYAPESGILIPINMLFCEHWMYLPSIGLFLGCAETLAQITTKPSRLSYASSALALFFAGAMFIKTYDQNQIWRDPVTFYNNILRYENSIHAYSNLGNYYSDQGDYSDALDQYQKALAISDTNATMRYDMALAYMKMQGGREHLGDVISNLERSLELDPTFYRSNKLLGDIYDSLGDKQKSQYFYDRAKDHSRT